MNAVALFALVLLEALVAAAFSAALIEQRLSEGTRFAREAFGAAEGELARALAAGPSSPAVRQLGARLYLIDVTAPDRARHGRRRLGLLAELRPPAIRLDAGVTTQGELALEAGARVVAIPDSCATDSSVTAIAIVPEPLEGVDHAALRDQASLRLAGGTYSPAPVMAWPADGGEAACDTEVATNWGDGVASTTPCAPYHPIVHVQGDLELTGGHGQGVLLVDGDLLLAGPFQFVGLVIVSGSVRTAASGVSGAKLVGQVVVGNPSAARQTLAGDLAVHSSKCHVLNVLASKARLDPLRSRAWIQLF